MKKILFMLLFSLALPAGAEIIETVDDSRPHAVTIMTNITGGTYGWTNEHLHPIRPTSIEYTLPASSTNDFTWSIVRRYDEEILYKGEEIVTNAFDLVETNNYWSITNVTINVSSNTLLTETTADVEYHRLGYTSGYNVSNTIPEDYFVQPHDVLYFTWDVTDSIPFIFSSKH